MAADIIPIAQAALPPRRATIPSDLWLYVAIALMTVAIRAPVFADLNYHIDEGFYLLVGDRMREGLLPYADIWDRKPLGLFLVYGAIAAISRGSIVAVHLGASICAAGNAALIALIARRWVAPVPAVTAAIAYLAALETLAGGGGQSPVFYNLPVSAMAWLTLRAHDARSIARVRVLARFAVACGGIALTIKQTCLPECLFFGIVLTHNVYRLALGWRLVVREAALLASIGALPTLACLLFYTVIGYGSDYLFATMLSNFGRMPMAWSERAALASYLAPRILPLLLCALAGVALLWRQARPNGAQLLLSGWIASSLAGFLMVPNFYDHYALPLLPSLCVAAAFLFARHPLGPIFAAIVIASSLALAGWPAFDRTRATNAAMQTAARTIAAHGGDRSLYVFDGPVHLYTLVGAPLPTRWVFPEHLSTAEEHGATGADAARELTAILKRRPAVIVAAGQPGARHPHPAAWHAVRTALAAEYTKVATIEVPEFGGSRVIGIFALHTRKAAASSSPPAR